MFTLYYERETFVHTGSHMHTRTMFKMLFLFDLLLLVEIHLSDIIYVSINKVLYEKKVIRHQIIVQKVIMLLSFTNNV